MHWLLQPGHLAMVLGLVSLVLSEILPFLPTKANGIVHAIVGMLQAVKGQLPPAPPSEGPNA